MENFMRDQFFRNLISLNKTWSRKSDMEDMYLDVSTLIDKSIGWHRKSILRTIHIYDLKHQDTEKKIWIIM